MSTRRKGFKTSGSDILRERMNWHIHALYTRGEYNACLELIEEQLYVCKGQCEYPIYVKALIYRQQGKVVESLSLFQYVRGKGFTLFFFVREVSAISRVTIINVNLIFAQNGHVLEPL